MSHVDEGLIHAWLEDQLPPDEAARIEQLVATDAAWGAAAAEARGLIAASSRVLGALDSAPSAAATPITARTGRPERTGPMRSSWARKYWLRAAAAILLVAGVSGVWFRGFGAGDDVTIADLPRESAIPAEGVGGPPSVAAPPPPTVQQKSSPVAPPTPQASAVDGRRDASRQLERVRAEQLPPVVSAATPPPATPPAMRDEASGVRAATAAKDSTADNRAAGNVGGVGSGRGGRASATGAAFEAASVGAQRSEAPRSDLMKSLATVGDSLQRGCWVPLESQAAQARQANESARPSVMVLQFVPPVITDLANAPAPALARVSTSPPPMPALRAAPPLARLQRTTARPTDDSTFVAEWMNPEGRTTQLTFRVRGDTLRGTTNAITGNIVIAGPVLVAVRAQCPQ